MGGSFNFKRRSTVSATIAGVDCTKGRGEEKEEEGEINKRAEAIIEGEGGNSQHTHGYGKQLQSREREGGPNSLSDQCLSTRTL